MSRIPPSDPAKHRAIAMAIVFAVAFVLYLPSIAYDFVWDDRTILMTHDGLDDWSRAGEHLTGNFFREVQEQTGFDYWRPMVVLTHMVEVSAFGWDPRAFHLTNVVLHAIASVLVLLLAIAWFPGRVGVALVSALVFAVHPVHTEVVAWVSGRSDLLCGLFLLVALVGDRRWADTGGRRWLAVALFGFAAAVFSKELAIVFPALVFTRGFLLAPEGDEPRARIVRGARATVPSFVVLAALLTVRGLVIDGASGVGSAPAEGRMAAFWTWWTALLLYGKQLVWPTGSNILHDLPFVDGPWNVRVLGGLALALAIAATIVRTWRTAPAVAYGLTAALFCLAPVSHFLVPLGSQGQAGFPFAERFAFAPSIGVALVLGHVLTVGLPRLFAGRRPSGDVATARPAAIATAVVGIGAAALLTANRLPDWRDEVTLFVATAEQVPDNAVARLNEAAALGDRAERESDPTRRRELIERADAAFTRALELDASNYRVHYGLANLRLLQGDLDAAEVAYAEALRLHPTLYEAKLNLGVLLARRGELHDAARTLREATELRPPAIMAKVNLAHVLAQLGRRDEAIRLYREVLAQEPDLAAARRGLESVTGAP